MSFAASRERPRIAKKDRVSIIGVILQGVAYAFVWSIRRPVFTTIVDSKPMELVFFIGTVIRVRSDEELLRKAFGSEFEAYTNRVPAFVPGIF